MKKYIFPLTLGAALCATSSAMAMDPEKNTLIGKKVIIRKLTAEEQAKKEEQYASEKAAADEKRAKAAHLEEAQRSARAKATLIKNSQGRMGELADTFSRIIKLKAYYLKNYMQVAWIKPPSPALRTP